MQEHKREGLEGLIGQKMNFSVLEAEKVSSGMHGREGGGFVACLVKHGASVRQVGRSGLELPQRDQYNDGSASSVITKNHAYRSAKGDQRSSVYRKSGSSIF